jgi:O-antigen/teichoic acid export membrane protein
MSITNKLKSGGFWQTNKIVVQVITQFGYMMIMARLLEKSDFGLMALAYSFIGIGNIFSEGGMSAALVQRKNITHKHKNSALQGGILIGLFVYIIFYFSAPFIADFFDQPKLNLLLKVIAVNTVLHSINGISLGLLQKRFEFKKIAVITILASIIGYFIGIILAYKDFGVWSLVTATLTITTTRTFTLFYYAPVKFSLKFHLKEWKELFSFGFGMILLKINNYMGNKGLNLILGKIFAPGVLGVFERTFRIKNLPSRYLGRIIDSTMFPAMSEIQNEDKRLFNLYKFSIGFVYSLLLPLTCYLIFYAKEIVLILLGTKWLEAVLPLQIMFVVLPFSSSGRMADIVIRAKGAIYKNVRRKVLYVIVLIMSTGMGAYYFGIKGAAIGVTFSYIFNCIISLIMVKHIFRKTLKIILTKPIIESIKLSFFTMFFTIVMHIFLGFLMEESIFIFIINTILFFLLLSYIVLNKPNLLGQYLNEIIYRLRNK